MASATRTVVPPKAVRGMTELNKDLFKLTLKVPTYRVADPINIPNVSKVLKPYFLRLYNFKAVIPTGDGPKSIILNPDAINGFDSLSASDQRSLKEMGFGAAQFGECDVDITYDNWKTEDIFAAVLPEDVEGVSSYSVIGHLIHVNLRDQLIEYKHLIGQVLLDKIKMAKCVINKSNIIESEYRNFQFEVLAGEPDTVVVAKENGCSFKMDFKDVYWNPKLSTEHARIVDKLNNLDVLFDLFCGIGPFAIPAAKRKLAQVYANDLNPSSYKWLLVNVKDNKIKHDRVSAYNMDAKDFIASIFADQLIALTKNPDFQGKVHVTMNLPAFALNFLKYFKGLLSGKMADVSRLHITVHFYCFLKMVDERELKNAARGVVESEFGLRLEDSEVVDYSYVNNVAPSKDMVRLSFKMGGKILCPEENLQTAYLKREIVDRDVPSKKRKL